MGRGSAIVWFSESEKWTRPLPSLIPSPLPKGWSIRPATEVAKPIEDRVVVAPEEEYSMLGVRWYGEGTFIRETVTGKEMSARYVNRVYPGALIYNRLFAWKESFAVVPDEHEGCFVSNEFPQFVIDQSKVLPQYLCLICLSKPAIEAVNIASIGSAAVSRNRFKEDDFLRFVFPLPPIPHQRIVIKRWQESQDRIDKALAEIQSISDDLNEELLGLSDMKDATQRWLRLLWSEMGAWDAKSGRASAFRLSNKDFLPMSTWAEEATETVRPWEEPDKEWPVYGVSNKEGVIFSHYQKGSEFNATYKRIRKDCFFHNPTRASVGSLGIVPDVPEDAITSPEYQVWRLKPDGMLPDFVAVLIRTKWFVQLIQFHRVGAVKQRLFVENLLEIRIPEFPKGLQKEISARRRTAIENLAKAKEELLKVKGEVEEMILGIRPIPG